MIHDFIVQSSEDPFAIYLGGIVALGTLARGNLRSAMHNEVVNHWAKKTPTAFTRPVTKRGLELIEEYGFTAVAPVDAGKIDALYSKVLTA